MGKGFIAGACLGFLGGALLLANSYKARKLMKDGQENLKKAIGKLTNRKNKRDEFEESEE